MRQQSASDSQMVQGENVIWTIMSLYRTSDFSLFVIFFKNTKIALKNLDGNCSNCLECRPTKNFGGVFFHQHALELLAQVTAKSRGLFKSVWLLL